MARCPTEERRLALELEKLGAGVGVSTLHIYAARRGQTLEEFQKTRNAPGALYSVAGKDARDHDWDRPPR